MHGNSMLDWKEKQRDWMSKGRTVLIQNDKSNANEANNYCPITCLPLTWRLLTGIIIVAEIDGFPDNEGMLTRRAERMQKEVKGYWGPIIHR